MQQQGYAAWEQEHPNPGPAFMHVGALAAAKALWTDLEQHGILEVLLSSGEQQAKGPGSGCSMDGEPCTPSVVDAPYTPASPVSNDGSPPGGSAFRCPCRRHHYLLLPSCVTQCHVAQARGAAMCGCSASHALDCYTPNGPSITLSAGRDRAPTPCISGDARARYAASVMRRGLHKQV